MTTAPKHYLTAEEYLAIERKAQYKSEYHNGAMFAMAVATENHILLVTNLSAEFREKLRAGPCRVYSTDMRVSTSPTGRYVCPDVTVVCSKPLFRDETLDTLLNPALICEVLSPSTRDYDRGDKFASYRTIASCREYLTVDSNDVHIEQYVRRENGAWLLTDHRNLADVIQLHVGVAFRVADIYEKVDFSQRSSA